MCNAAKDGMMTVKGADASTTRGGVGGGFREFDDAEEQRRKRRAEEERMEKEQRKAMKTKCQFCKRASCIC